VKDKITISFFAILIVSLVLTGFIFTKIQNLQSTTKEVQTQVASLREAVKPLLAQAIPATPAQPSPGTGIPATPAIPASPAAPAAKSPNFDIYYNPYCAVSENYYSCPPNSGPPFMIIRTSLKRGSSGYEVKQLQGFLKQYPEIYPEGYVTGYYGPLTESAVKKFQEEQGIEPVGVVGPKTKTKLNEAASSLAPSIVPLAPLGQ